VYTAGDAPGRHSVLATEHRPAYHKNNRKPKVDTALVHIREGSDDEPSGAAQYDTARLRVGDRYYIDRALTLTALGPADQDWLWIRTANDDKASTAASFFSFTLLDSAVVAVAYDRRGTTLPDWLQGWPEAPQGIGVSDTEASPLRVFYQTQGPGPVALGGNLAGGAVGAQSMYVVLLLASAALAPTTISVTPATVTLAPGETAQFSASFRDQLGRPIGGETVWAATGGSITAAGAYTAGDVAGTYQVTATEQATGLADTAQVTIQAPPPSGTGDLEVTSSTTGEDLDPDGYTVTVDGTSSQAIGITGSVSFTDLAAGDHAVQLSGLAANCTVSGLNPRTITVSDGGLASTTFTVSCSSSTDFPGGFVEPATSTEARAKLTSAELANLLPPAGGTFRFPAPYNTEAVRLTDVDDCAATDCVDYVGYSYWRNMNNHVGQNDILIFLGLSNTIELFTYNKLTDAVAKLGPILQGTGLQDGRSGETMYFSGTRPTTLYLTETAASPRLVRLDVITKAVEVVFDVSTQYGSDKLIWQTHSSDDDRAHSATLRRSGTYEDLGCVAYREDLTQFFYYPTSGRYDECQIDRSGRWLLIKEDVNGDNRLDNRIIDLETGAEDTLLDQDGAAGHSDMGHGYLVAADDWNSLPNAVRVWDLAQNPLQGPLVYHGTEWGGGLGHISHLNSRPGTSIADQYACNSNASRSEIPRANEIVCYRLDGSLDVLVVAPVMTDLDAAGGGSDYGKRPKGNLDVTGRYFIWTSNTAGGRLDAFIVKVPSHLLY
jgi:hypothetical protein